MQCGFAFLEAGSVRSKNVTNILIKNLLDSFVSGLSYWLIGYALAYGSGNKFIGYEYFAHAYMPDDQYAKWFFQYVFAATAATIVSGAVAERCDFNGYLVYSFLITGFVYPVVTHWTWSGEGWLSDGSEYINEKGEVSTVAYNDFAGSGVVHTLGGTAAFVGALFLGARKGRFDEESGYPVEIKGHSLPFAALGGFVLLFGFFAFNGGSQAAISNPGDGIAIAISIVNTVAAATGGGFVVLVLNKTPLGDGKWSMLSTVNGCLTGMVSACAGCNDMYTWGAFVTGLIGGVVYMLISWSVVKLRVDDPLDATAVHFGGGVTGVITIAFLSKTYGILFFGDNRSGLHLAWQLAGLAAIIGWTAVLSILIFGGLKLLGILRVNEEMELKGLDIPKHGEPAYPAESYGHGWGEKGDSLVQMAGLSIVGKGKTQDVMKKRELSRPSGNPEIDARNRKNLAASYDSGINNGVVDMD
ncbi:putative ammonium transporter 1 [Liolophura sinensis]|uniref:putative ammonium transporter 1 n=1 Tax=Liolophura sinensis TaxID=3198878 RepID=UPI00315877E5